MDSRTRVVVAHLSEALARGDGIVPVTWMGVEHCRAMAVVVHIAGGADLSVVTGRSREGEKQWEVVHDRLAWLDAHTPEEGVAVLRNYTWDTVDTHPTSGKASPLVRHLSGLPASTDISLLLCLGTSQPEGKCTLPIAEALAEAVRFAPGAFGRSVKLAVAVDVGRLHEADAFPRIGHAVSVALDLDEGAPGAVSLNWGSGATAIGLAAFAALLKLGAEVTLVDPDSGSELSFDPQPGPLDARLCWYLQLGYPRLALQRSIKRPEGADDLLRELAARHDLTDVYAPRAVCLAEQVGGALRRRDGSAGLALRAALAARYVDLLEREETNLFELPKLQGPDGGPPSFGEVIAYQRRQGARTGAERFLVDDATADLNRAGSKAAHQLTPVSTRERRLAARVVEDLLDDDTLSEKFQRVGLPAITRTPTGQVLVLWVVGTEAKKALGPGLVDVGVGEAVLTYLGLRPENRGVVDLRALLLFTEQTELLAAAQAQDLNNGAGNHASTLASASAQTLSVDRTDPDGSRVKIRDHLQRGDCRPEAVVVLPSGDKSLVLPALLAALDWAGQQGVPVFVRELTCPADGGVVSYHQLAGYLETDGRLADAALHCLQRLDLDTAARLLSAGTPQLQGLGEKCQQLAGALRNDPTQWPPGLPTAPADRGAGLLQARLALFLCAFKANNARAWGGAEQLKLAHLSWSVIEVSLGPDFGELVGHLNKVKVGRRNHPPLTAIDCEQALAVLVVLRRVRNRLPISHGRPRDPAGLQRVIDLAFRPNGGRLTFGELLELAVAAVGQVFPRPPGTIDDRLIVLFESLLGQLETLV